MKNMKYNDWLMGKFNSWEKETGKRQSFSAFSRYLGVKQSSLSQWLAGNYPPTGENVEKIAQKCGDEIYEVLGLISPRREEDVDISSLPDELQIRFRTAMKEIDDVLNERGLISGSTEGLLIIRKTFGKYGFTITTKEKSE